MEVKIKTRTHLVKIMGPAGLCSFWELQRRIYSLLFISFGFYRPPAAFGSWSLPSCSKHLQISESSLSTVMTLGPPGLYWRRPPSEDLYLIMEAKSPLPRKVPLHRFWRHNVDIFGGSLFWLPQGWTYFAYLNDWPTLPSS